MLRRLARILGRALAGLLLLLIAAYLLRGPLLARPLARFVAGRISDELGGRFSLQRVEGDWLTTLVLVGLETETPPPDGALRALAFDRAVVRHRLGTLLSGDLAGAIREATVDGLRLALDTKAPTAPGEGAPPTAVLDAIPDPLPALRVSGSVTVRTGDGTASAQFRVEGGGRRFDLVLRELSLFSGGPEPEFRATVEREDGATLALRPMTPLAGIETPLVRVRFPKSGGVEADASLRLAGGVVDARLRTDSLDVDARGVDLAKVPAPLRRLVPEAVPETGLVDLQGQASFRDRRGRVDSLRFESPFAAVAATGVAIELDRPYLVGDVTSLDASTDDLSAIGAQMGAELPAARVRATMRRGVDGVVAIESLEIARRESRASLRGTASLPDEPSRWRETRLDLAFDARVSDAGDLAPPRVADAVRGSARVSGRIEGTLAAPLAHLTAEGEDLLLAERPVRSFRLVGDLAWPRLDLREARLAGDPGRLELSGSADLEARTLRDATLRADIPDLGGFLAMLPGAPRASGRVDATARIALAAWDGRVEGAVTLRATSLHVDGREIGALDFEATAKERDVEVASVSASGAWGSVAARGSATLGEGGGDARVDALVAERKGRRVTLVRPLALSWGGGALSWTGLDAEALGGTVRGSGRWGEEVELAIDAAGVSLEGIVDGLDGAATVELRAEGPRARPRLALVVDAPHFSWRGREGAASFRAEQRGEGVAIEALRIALGEDAAVEGSIALPLAFGAGGVVRAEGAPFSGSLRGTVAPGLLPDLPADFARLEFGVDAGADALRAWVACTDLELRGGRGGAIRAAGEARLEATSDASGTTATFASSGAPPFSASATVRSERTWDARRPAALLDGWRDAALAGTARIEVPDLAPFEGAVGTRVRVRGSARADVELSGTLGAPRFSGTAEVDAESVKLEGELPAMREVVARLRLSPERAVLERCEGRLGYAPFSVEGAVDLAAVPAPLLDFRVRGDDVLLARSPYLLLRADLDVRLTGSVDAPKLTGSARITDALYSRPMRLLPRAGGPADDGLELFSVRDEPWRRMEFDLAVAATETVRLRNNVFRGTASCDLRLRGTGEVPQPEGRVDVRDMLVILTSSRLKVDSGQAVFPPGSPFAPRIEATARARLRGYDLTVQVTGQVPDVRVHVASQPPLARADALVLLTTGNTPAEIRSAGVGWTALSTAGSYVAGGILEGLSGPADPDSETLFDRFSLEIGRDVSATGQPTVVAEFRLADRWFLAAERDRYDAYNAGLVYRIRFR